MPTVTLTTFECTFSPTTHYYVEMPCNCATPMNNHEEDQLVVNLEDPTFELNDLINPNQIQEIVRMVNLLFFS